MASKFDEIIREEARTAREQARAHHSAAKEAIGDAWIAIVCEDGQDEVLRLLSKAQGELAKMRVQVLGYGRVW